MQPLCKEPALIMFFGIGDLCRQSGVNKAREVDKRQESRGPVHRISYFYPMDYVASDGFIQVGVQSKSLEK